MLLHETRFKNLYKHNVMHKKPYTARTHLYEDHKQAELIYGIRSHDCDSFGEDNTWDDSRGKLVMFWEILLT